MNRLYFLKITLDIADMLASGCDGSDEVIQMVLVGCFFFL